MKLWVKILLAMVLGVATGIVFGPKAEVLKPLGTIFLGLINMIIVLLVLASMTLGISRIHDPKKLGRVGIMTLALYLGTTVISIMIGLSFASYFEPGAGMGMVSENPIVAPSSPSLGDMLLSVIPSNPIASLVSGNVLQIIVFSIFLGVSISAAGERGRPVLELIEALAEIMYQITAIVMEFSPIGVFAIMASVVGSFGAEILKPLMKLTFVIYFGSLLHMLVVFSAILLLIARLNPIPFFRGMTDAIMVAFSTGSSSASLPVTMQCAQRNLGVSRGISSFVLPLGCTVNMNGTAMFQAMSAVFLSQAYGIHLDLQSTISIIVTATLSAVGTAGIPGSGFIMLSAVLTSAGLPIEGLAILAGIDRIRDMIGTVLNVVGDAVVATAVAKNEGELDEAVYFQKTHTDFEESEI